jgi:hypothetical protein
MCSSAIEKLYFLYDNFINLLVQLLSHTKSCIISFQREKFPPPKKPAPSYIKFIDDRPYWTSNRTGQHKTLFELLLQIEHCQQNFVACHSAGSNVWMEDDLAFGKAYGVPLEQTYGWLDRLGIFTHAR